MKIRYAQVVQTPPIGRSTNEKTKSMFGVQIIYGQDRLPTKEQSARICAGIAFRRCEIRHSMNIINLFECECSRT